MGLVSWLLGAGLRGRLAAASLAPPTHPHYPPLYPPPHALHATLPQPTVLWPVRGRQVRHCSGSDPGVTGVQGLRGGQLFARAWELCVPALLAGDLFHLQWLVNLCRLPKGQVQRH